MTTNLPLVQLWQHGTVTCLITPAAQPAPYCVIVEDGREPLSQRSFDNHDDATACAVEELRRATAPNEDL